ncbi:hypothetical protein BJ742DRAFT_856657 [Cladochytrium replicatum]|nr:hypothetical protein BJ742DRAFT_856657 [Cladochytrium replicatum]
MGAILDQLTTVMISRTLLVAFVSALGLQCSLAARIPMQRRALLSDTIEASYTAKSAGFLGRVEGGPVVDLYAKTAIPSLNFDKFPSAATVTCDDAAKTVTVKFASGANAVDISKTWAPNTPYLLLINHAFCDPGRAEWKVSQSFQAVAESNSLVFTGISRAANVSEQFLDDYTITVSGVELEQSDASAASLPEDEEGESEDRRRLRRLSRRGELKVKFGPTPADAPDIKLSDNFAMSCRSCSIEATARMDVQVTRKGLKLKTKLDSAGTFKAAIGLHMVVSADSSQFGIQLPSASVPLVNIPLSPFSIAGVVTLGPVFDVTLSAGINSVSGSAAFSGGFDVTAEGGSAFSTQMDQETDGGAGNFSPQVKIRPLTFDTAKIAVSGSMSIVPAFKMGIQAFGKDVATAGVKLVNKVTMDAQLAVSSSGNTGSCPNGLQVGAKYASTVGANIGPFEKDPLFTITSGDIFSTCLTF